MDRKGAGRRQNAGLNGQKAIVVHYEEICLSAGLARQEVI
jgi:hypothetical protein